MLPSITKTLALFAAAGAAVGNASPLLPVADVVKRNNWTPPAGLNVTYQSPFNA